MRRILIIKHGAFGDVIQSEGALHDIRENHPGDDIAVLTTPAYRRIFERCPWVDRVLVDPRDPRWRLDRMWKLGKRLKAEKFDMVYDLQNSARTATYFRWFFQNTNWSGTAPGVSHPHRAKNPKKIRTLDRLAGQLKDAGLTIRHTRKPDVSWLADDVTPILDEAGVREPYIVLIPGCSARHPEKRWPYYAELAQRLIDEGQQVVMAPGPDEVELAKTIPGIRLQRKSGFFTWSELAGILKRAAFVVGNDTGPTHLASHLGTQGLALFGPYAPAALTGIERENFTAIEVQRLSALPVERVLDEVHLRVAAIETPYMTSLQ
ncbi:MAG: glycosyltransferase family 9 protein [Parvibaculum sp.]|uniref:glycosyltransferase family 9 protein n=1 Tax=Parvibaculum sp. TaxID=2024848 RepID=UPI0028477817|nr:glycosyltransferase family 9 protein [Parvibaculum sp.]MDR3497655.1 glycosyltransferase family 9 protein [Parvibaculum sp.]